MSVVGGWTAGHLGLGLGDGTTKGVVARRTPDVLAAYARAWPLLPICCLLVAAVCGRLRNECDVA
jgi:hypothetical protein